MKDPIVSTTQNGYRGVTREVLCGEHDEPCKFHVRQYDVEPGGFTRLERHEHVHSVTVVRGHGYAIVGNEVRRLEPLAHVYVPPMTLHQFVNEGDEPLRFLCVVDAQRDRPQQATPKDVEALESTPATAGKARI